MESPLEAHVVLAVGPLVLTMPVVVTWLIMAVLSTTSWLLTRRPSGRVETVLEALVGGIVDQIGAVMCREGRPFLPLVGTLFLFIAIANIAGLVPGLEAPTARLETPAALGTVVFLAIQYFGVRTRGLGHYAAHFTKPHILMLPLKLLEELTRIFSLTIRLFGNVMSGEFVVAIMVLLAGLFMPVPFMLIELLIGLIQAYIFATLATVFIGGAVSASDD